MQVMGMVMGWHMEDTAVKVVMEDMDMDMVMDMVMDMEDILIMVHSILRNRRLIMMEVL
jgi:hypothetical protein